MYARRVWGIGMATMAALLLQSPVSEAQGVARGPYGGPNRSSKGFSGNPLGFRPFSVGVAYDGWAPAYSPSGIANYGYAHTSPGRYRYLFSTSLFGYPSYTSSFPSVYYPSSRFTFFPNYRPAYAEAALQEAPYPTTAPTETSPNAVYLKVIVPQADAQLIFDGHPTHQTGSQREFVTWMAAGTTGVYHVKVRWTQNGTVQEQTRTIPVRPGLTEVINFNQPLHTQAQGGSGNH